MSYILEPKLASTRRIDCQFLLLSLTTQRQTQPAAAAVVAVFAEPDALPGAEGEAIDAAAGFDR